MKTKAKLKKVGSGAVVVAAMLMLVAYESGSRRLLHAQSQTTAQKAPADRAVSATPAQGGEDVEAAAKLRELAHYMDGARARYVLEDAYMRWPLAPADQVYADLDGQRIMADLKVVTGISLRSKNDGVQYWGRIAGTKYDAMNQQWLMKKFQDIGLQDVRRQEFDMPPQWFPDSWEMNFTAGGASHKLESAFPFSNTPATPAAGVDLETAYVGLGRAADFVGRDVKGKAAVIYALPGPGVRDNSSQWFGAVERAQKHQAAAVIVIVGFPGNMQSQSGQPASSAPAVTTFLLGNDDGTALIDAIDKALPGPGPKVHVRLAAKMNTGWKTATVFGTLPGATDENILVQSTMDSFFQGAMDNASGLATMVALAEHFAKIPQAQRRRTIIFAGTPAHHAGDPGVHWMHDNRDTFFAKTALIINCVHIAQTQTYVHGPFLQLSDAVEAHRWTVRGSDKLDAIMVHALADFGVTSFSKPDVRGAGALSIDYKDAPSLMIYEMGPFYHTTMDTPEMVPAPGLEAAARAFAKIIDQVNKVDRKDLLAAPDVP